MGLDKCFTHITKCCQRTDVEQVIQWAIDHPLKPSSIALVFCAPNDGVFPKYTLPKGSKVTERSTDKVEWTDDACVNVRKLMFVTDPFRYPKGLCDVNCLIIKQPFVAHNRPLFLDFGLPYLTMLATEPEAKRQLVLCMSQREFMAIGLPMELQATIKKRRGDIIPEAEEKVYYFASPYSHPSQEVVVERYERVILAAWELITKKRYTLIEPIAMSHEKATRYEMPTDFAFWGKMDKLLISKTDGVIVCMLDGWQESKGVTQEIAFAKERGLPVFYYCPTSSKFVTKDEQSTSE